MASSDGARVRTVSVETIPVPTGGNKNGRRHIGVVPEPAAPPSPPTDRGGRLSHIAPIRPIALRAGPVQTRLPRRYRLVDRDDDTTTAMVFLVALLVLVGVAAVIALGGPAPSLS